jgi:hypothetical protein
MDNFPRAVHAEGILFTRNILIIVTETSAASIFCDRLCDPVVQWSQFPTADPELPGSITGCTRFLTGRGSGKGPT